MGFDGAGGTNLGTAYAEIKVDLNSLESQFNTAFDRAERSITDRLSGMGDRLQSAGASMTMAFSPITAFLGQGVAVFAEFDDILVEIKARTGATAEEMEAVRVKALQMG